MNLLRSMGLLRAPKGVVLDAWTLEQVAELDCGGYRGSVAADDESVWFSTWSDKSVSRVDPATRQVLVKTKLPEEPSRIVPDRMGPLVHCWDGLLLRLDPSGETVIAESAIGTCLQAIAAGEHRLWGLTWTVDDSGDGQVGVVEIDPGSLAVMREMPVGRSIYTGDLRVEEGTVSALIEIDSGTMGYFVVDEATGERLPADRAPERPRGIAERDGTRWLRDKLQVRRANADGSVEATAKLPGPKAGDTILAFDQIWACNYREPRPAAPGHLD